MLCWRSRTYQAAASIEAPASSSCAGVCQAPSDEATLVAAYHASARAELIARIGHRDSSMFLYTAAVGALFAVFLASYPKGALALLVVPLISFGAALVHSQHNTVIGALGVYIGAELHQTAASETDAGRVRSWDASDTLHKLRGHIGSRLWASLLLLIGPSAVSIALVTHAIGVGALPADKVDVSMASLGSAAAAAAAAMLVRAERRRKAFRAEVARVLSAGV